MREVSQVHLCSCLFNLFEDFVSHSAPNDIRRQHTWKWTEWHIKWACRSCCNGIWAAPAKYRISFYLLITSCGLPFTAEEQRLTHSSTVLAQPSGSYGSATITLQTHQNMAHKNFPAEGKPQIMKRELFYMHILWKRSRFTTVITTWKLEETHQTKDSQEGRDQGLHPQSHCHKPASSPFSFKLCESEIHLIKGFSILYCTVLPAEV